VPPAIRWRPLTAFPLAAVLGLLHPIAGGVLRRGLKFQTCTNTLNNFFLQFREFLAPPHVYIYIFIFINRFYLLKFYVMTLSVAPPVYRRIMIVKGEMECMWKEPISTYLRKVNDIAWSDCGNLLGPGNKRR